MSAYFSDYDHLDRLIVITQIGDHERSASDAGLVAMIPHAVSLSLFAHGSYDEGQLFRHTLGSARFTLGLLVPAIAGVLLLGDKILLLFGRAYSEQATRLLWVLVLTTLPMTVNFLFFSVRRVQQKVAGLAWLAAQSSVALVLLARLALDRRLM